MKVNEIYDDKRLELLQKETFKQRISNSKKDIGVIIVFLMVCMVYYFSNPVTFSQFPIYYSFMITIPIVGIVAIPCTFIVILGETDLSFTSTIALSGYVTAMVFLGTGSVVLGILCGLATGVACGLVNALFVVRLRIPAIVTTIGTQYLFKGIMLVMCGGNSFGLTGLKTASDSWAYKLLVGRLFGAIPAQFIWFVVLTVVFTLILRRHRYGLHLCFTGDNAGSAVMMGINTNRVRTIAFVLVGVCAALAGIINCFELTYFYTSQGGGLMLPILASVYVGGTSVYGGSGSILGTFLGALLMGSLEAGIVALGVSGFWLNVLYGAIIITAVTIYTLIMKKSS
jgi:simple sugar transport system permease protein